MSAKSSWGAKTGCKAEQIKKGRVLYSWRDMKASFLLLSSFLIPSLVVPAHSQGITTSMMSIAQLSTYGAVPDDLVASVLANLLKPLYSERFPIDKLNELAQSVPENGIRVFSY